ncbi:HD domain-containing protein [Castellaniella ginsengisoli]
MTIRSYMRGGVIAVVLIGAVATIAGPAASRADSLDRPQDRALNTRMEVAGVRIPSGELGRGAAQLIRETEGELLFEHSSRVFYWASLAGRRRNLSYDPELLYVAAMFHDFGLTQAFGQSRLRFEVDGANAAKHFLRSHGVSEVDSQMVWLAIALHTTNGISPHLSPIAELLAEGANMDLIGAGFENFTPAQRDAVEIAHPRPSQFADLFMQALYQGLKHRPQATQGTGLADVMAYKDSNFVRRDFSRLMRESPWAIGK